MNLFKRFLVTDTNTQQFANRLHEKIFQKFPNSSEKDALVMACLSGLLARVAYSDLKITESEIKKIQNIMVKILGISEEKAQLVCELAISEQKELSGLENHMYGQALIDILSEKERFEVLEAMFAIAASDEEVSNLESEEIRLICKSLNLEHKHFISARAQVKDFLAALK